MMRPTTVTPLRFDSSSVVYRAAAAVLLCSPSDLTLQTAQSATFPLLVHFYRVIMAISSRRFFSNEIALSLTQCPHIIRHYAGILTHLGATTTTDGSIS